MFVVWMGVRVVIHEMEIMELWMEGDSLIVIQWLTKHAWTTNFLLHPLVQDLLLWKHTFLTIWISHILRECNRATNYLAIQARMVEFNLDPGKSCSR